MPIIIQRELDAEKQAGQNTRYKVIIRMPWFSDNVRRVVDITFWLDSDGDAAMLAETLKLSKVTTFMIWYDHCAAVVGANPIPKGLETEALLMGGLDKDLDPSFAPIKSSFELGGGT